MASKKVPAGSTAKAVTADVAHPHTIKVGETAVANVEGHAARVDSKEFIAARSALHKILAEQKDHFFGHGDGENAVQAHHGGSIWVHDGEQWRMYLNLAGIEWSAQFSCDPASVDKLRENALFLTKVFPATIGQLQRIGYTDAEKVLNTKIVDAAGIAAFTDSLFNACVPLPQKVHTGAITASDSRSAGRHTYPAPNTDIVFICRKDFTPFVFDKGAVVHVHAVAPAGSSDKRVRVVHVSDPKHPLHKKHANAEKAGKVLTLEAHDPIAQKAFSGPGG